MTVITLQITKRNENEVDLDSSAKVRHLYFVYLLVSKFN